MVLVLLVVLVLLEWNSAAQVRPRAVAAYADRAAPIPSRLVPAAGAWALELQKGGSGPCVGGMPVGS